MLSSIQELLLKNPNFKQSRLNSLFSDFGYLKESNPEGYEANITTWKTFLNDLLLNHPELLEEDEKFAINSSNLVNRLTIFDGAMTYIPKGLDKVINEMVNTDHTMVPYSSFVNATKPGLVSSFLSKIFGSSDKVTVKGFNSGNGNGGLISNEKFIHYEKMIQVSLRMLSFIKQNFSDTPVLSKHLFILINQEEEFNRFDFNCCLLYLSKLAKLIEFNEADEIISVPITDSTKSATPIDYESLKAIAELNYSIYLLTNKCNETSKRIEELMESARDLIQNKKPNEAKLKLKSKRLLERQLNTSHAGLEKLYTIQSKIQEANNNMLTVNILQSNSKVLKALNEKAGRERVDDLIDELTNQVDQVDDVTVQLGGLAIEDDTEELDDELEQMRVEEEKKLEEKTKAEEPTKKKEEMVTETNKEEENVTKSEPAAAPIEKSNDEDLLARFSKLKAPNVEPVASAATPKKIEPKKEEPLLES